MWWAEWWVWGAFARWGVAGGLAYTGLATHVTKGREPWTLSSSDEHLRDSETTQPAAQFEPIDYPAPDGVLTFDLLTNYRLRLGRAEVA